MNIQRQNSAHHFRMQSEREQTLVLDLILYHYITSSRSNLVSVHH